MANPIPFPGCNKTLVAPKGMEDVVQPIQVYSTDQICVVASALTADELAEVLQTGIVWSTYVMGGTMPPSFIGSQKSVNEVIVQYGARKITPFSEHLVKQKRDASFFDKYIAARAQSEKLLAEYIDYLNKFRSVLVAVKDGGATIEDAIKAVEEDIAYMRKK